MAQWTDTIHLFLAVHFQGTSLISILSGLCPFIIVLNA